MRCCSTQIDDQNEKYQILQSIRDMEEDSFWHKSRRLSGRDGSFSFPRLAKESVMLPMTSMLSSLPLATV
jgi:hypothetical protein